MGVGSSFWRRVVLFFVCLLVCLFFSTPKVGDYFVIKLNCKLSLTSGWGFLVFLFSPPPFKMFNFPTIYLGSGRFFFVSPVGKVFCFLLFLFVCFYFFYFFLFPKIPPPLISNVAPLSLFYYTDDGGHYVIDNFEFPCNSVKNLIPIWNFTNTFIQECKIIWEFQIRWGGTSLLKPLWRSWRYLKWIVRHYSLMSNRGRFQNFENLQRRPVEPNSMWQHRLTWPLHTVHGNSQTKLILSYFKRGSTLNLNGFSVKIFFLHKILGIFEFFYL